MTLKEIEELIGFVAKANISEVEMETKDIKLVIKTSKGVTEHRVERVIQEAVAPVAPIAKPAAPATPAAPVAPKSDDSKYVTVKSPMIGTFYRSSAPDKPAFVNVGDKIEKGKVICIIEAMKLFNEIEAEVSGTIVKVLSNDASPIEYDQPLFLVDPS
ncbi:MAG TPA: acetyl-CoA carboxylase biotin carboxyl carrier protein [Bacteroidia bacterium]|nr:acetyl-CoA carboxylase biotin carboxyl carrier protein [Bacteroidia bacterium]